MATTNFKPRRNFKSSPIPELLEIYSNVRSIKSFALSPNFDKANCENQLVPAHPLCISYQVKRSHQKNRIHKGKAYYWSDNGKLTMCFSVAPFINLSVDLRIHRHCAEVTVNPTYHYLTRMSIGNIPSPGWLLRDIACLLLALNGYTLLYAAAMKLDGRTYLIGGLSNSGKTTLVESLIRTQSAKVLGDDIIAINSTGMIFPCPLVPTTAILSSIEKTTSKLTGVFFLERGTNAGPEPLSEQQTQNRMRALMSSNLKFSTNSILAAYSYYSDTNLVDAALSNSSDVLERSIKDAPGFVLRGDDHHAARLAQALIKTQTESRR